MILYFPVPFGIGSPAARIKGVVSLNKYRGLGFGWLGAGLGGIEARRKKKTDPRTGRETEVRIKKGCVALFAMRGWSHVGHVATPRPLVHSLRL